MKLGMFNTVEVDAFVDWILQEIARSLPPADVNADSLKVADRAHRLNDRIAKRAAEFISQSGLNLYKKARLAAKIRDGLTDRGYPVEFAKTFTFDLIGLISVAERGKGR